MADRLSQVRTAVLERNLDGVEGLVKKALEEGLEPEAVLNEALIGAMEIIGREFGEGRIYVPEMMLSALVMKKGLELVRPLLTGQAARPRGLILMATVQGDLHDIGKNIVAMMLEGAGFQVVDLGVDLAVEALVDKVVELKPDLLGLSALLTTTMPEMKHVIEVLAEKGLRERTKVIVGGAPVDARFAERIGADGYGRNATEAVGLARKLVTAYS